MNGLREGALGHLERLHGAPGDERAYLEFLRSLERALSPGARVLYGACANERRPGLLAGPAIGVVRLDLAELITEFQHPAAAEYPVGGVLPLVPQSGLFRTRFFAETLEPAGIHPGSGLVVLLARSPRRVEAATLVVPGEPGWEPSAEDRALIEQLAPHMVIAHRLQTSLAGVQREQEALVSVFDRLLLGVVFTDDAGGLVYANRSAAELIGHPPGFTEPDAILDDFTCAWRDLLVHRSQESVFVRAPDDGRLVQVLAAPIEWGEDDVIGGARFAQAFLIADSKQIASDPSDVLCEHFGLTPSEARLAVALASDRSLKEAAAELDITEATARSVLKGVFAKTDVHRQTDLVRMLVRGTTGQVRAHASARGTKGRARRTTPRAAKRSAGA